VLFWLHRSDTPGESSVPTFLVSIDLLRSRSDRFQESSVINFPIFLGVHRLHDSLQLLSIEKKKTKKTSWLAIARSLRPSRASLAPLVPSASLARWSPIGPAHLAGTTGSLARPRSPADPRHARSSSPQDGDRLGSGVAVLPRRCPRSSCRFFCRLPRLPVAFTVRI
jgi:hypothetical protein